MESVDKNFICRLCLLDSDDFTNIFDVYVRNGFVAADLIKDLLQFNVSKTDDYPPVVCRPCLCNLTNFKHFKEQCITSKATYDNVFPLKEEILDSTLQLDVATIKEEEVDVDFSSDVRSIRQTEEDVTETSCGPILLKYEMLPFNRDDNPQESDVREEEGIEQTSNGSEDKSSQECEDPLRGVSEEEANCEASSAALMIGRGKSNSKVEKCRGVQVNEANNVKCFGEHRTYRNKRKEQLQVAECKDQWKNLRGCYTRHLKSAMAPSGSAAKYKKPYYLSKYVSFLQPYAKSRKSSSNISTVQPSVSSHETIEDDDASRGCVSDAGKEIQGICQQKHLDPTNNNQSFNLPASKKCKDSSNHPMSIADVNKSAVKYFESKRRFGEHKTEDPDLSFLKSVLPDMKEMSTVQKRRFKIGILNLAGHILSVYNESRPFRPRFFSAAFHTSRTRTSFSPTVTK